MEVWGIAKLVLRQYRSGNVTIRIAYAVISDTAAVLEPGSKAVLLFRHKDGTIYQVEGKVARLWKNMRYAEVRIPWTAAMALAEYAGRNVGEEKTVEIYDYAVRLKDVRPPPLH
jgi:predicted molibdopterin-dependent oxidoreductase YjgC